MTADVIDFQSRKDAQAKDLKEAPHVVPSPQSGWDAKVCPECGHTMHLGTDTQTKQRVIVCINCLKYQNI